MLLTILGIFVFLIVLSILVLIHELGHFLTARKFGIKVEEFGFGFPLTPALFSIKRGETKYSFYPVLIGGFVKLYGEDDAGGGSVKRKAKSEEATTDIKRAFFARPAWQRAVVVLAGVVMNFLLTIVIITYLFAGPGVTVPTGQARVTQVVSGSPASQIGLKNGDVILSFNGKKVTAIYELRKILADNGSKEGELIILRNGNEESYNVTPEKVVEEGRDVYLIGVQIDDSDNKKYPWYEAPFYGTIEVGKFTWLTITGLGNMVGDVATKGKPPTDAAGPIGIAQIFIKAVEAGFIPVLWLAAVISLNLAVINILPIPALDGGRLFFILIEMVTGRKVPAKYETYAHSVGLVVLLLLILAISIFDVTRIIQGKSLIPEM